MYQQVLRRFAHFNAIQLSEPAPLAELIMLALKEEDLNSEGNDNDDLKLKICEVSCFNLKFQSIALCMLFLLSIICILHIIRVASSHVVFCFPYAFNDISKKMLAFSFSHKK